MGRRMHKPGFTFLELLIALSLFTIGMVSILQIFPLNRRYLAQSSNTTQAVFLAQEEIESVRATEYDSLTVGTYEASHAMGTGSDPLSIYSRQTVVGLVDGSWNATATDVGLKKVTVTVTWTERNISRSYALSTYVHSS